MKVAIVGAGLSGLATSKYCIEKGISVDVFEQTGKIGGVWNYSENVGTDENGLPVNTVMYKNLITNLPKDLMTLTNFPYPDVPPSYVPQEKVLQYFQDYAKQFDLIAHIKFYKQVIKVDPLRSSEWKVTVRDAKTKSIEILEYDAIAICNGHYNKIIIPTIPGIESFKGKQLHSNAYRSPQGFENKKVLLIGAGPSGVDIAAKLSSVAEKVILSHKFKMSLRIPNAVVQKPVVKSISEDAITFIDGSSENVNVIIYCTGYSYDFPFLSSECGIKLQDRWIKHLYKSIINVKYQTMGFIGVTFECCVVPVNDLQAKFFVEALAKTFSLPSEQEMLQDIDNHLQELKSRGWSEQDMHRIGVHQGKYCDDVAKTGHLLPIPQVVHKLYLHVKMDRNNPNLYYKIIDDENFIIIDL